MMHGRGKSGHPRTSAERPLGKRASPRPPPLSPSSGSTTPRPELPLDVPIASRL
jgi:hypothetical protein